MANRLARESSPYLLQHQDNPVDWYPWGEEAFHRARSEDLPIFLSVGYSACHWCHVMERESFDDPETAAIMNDRFVCIKVDREERPDVDSIYMQAVQQMTGQGGWPMSVFLTPDGSPFYGGTYFPPEPRHNFPSFRQILTGVSDAYRARRGEVDRSAEDLRRALQQANSVVPVSSELEPSLLRRAVESLLPRFDSRHGGFGGAPKFPQPMIIEFLLAYGSTYGNREAISVAERTLEAMAAGGIHDQIGGGFHRYSVDAKWLVPHFEKMLYDNALLARAYLHAYQLTKRPDFRAVAEGVLRYVEREMRSPEGGFFSSQDADSEGVEGKFYVWSATEIDQALGPEIGPAFRLFYGVSEDGNWEGTNILHVARSAADVASIMGTDEARVLDLLERGRQILYTRRSQRVWPGRDDKIVTGWNAMMLHAFAEGAWVLGDSTYRETAIANARFIFSHLRQGDSLLRSWRDGPARVGAFLDDHALLVDALVALYGATFDADWVREARSVADTMIASFWSPEEGVFYDTPADGESLIVRPKDIYDNATPSGTSAAAAALLRLSRLTGDEGYGRIAAQVMGSLGEAASRFPQAFGHLLGALEVHLSPPSEVAVVGDPEAEETRAMLAALAAEFLPNTVIALKHPDAGTASESLLPLLADRGMRDGLPTAYVCQHYLCRQPVTGVDGLTRELGSVVGAAR